LIGEQERGDAEEEDTRDPHRRRDKERGQRGMAGRR